ncbi:MAG: DUF523 domain-containing protein [Christensenella sp.]|nr:DUF523 domain-containing protein [Christensenella sp.]MEA5002596.1 DUF523 domain-containing protein [Christensenella sp.]
MLSVCSSETNRFCKLPASAAKQPLAGESVTPSRSDREGASIVVSACLADIACRYDGQPKTNAEALRLVREKKAIALCPELMAGFPAPRPPAEIRGGDGFDVLDGGAKVYNKNGEDITDGFLRGAQKLLNFILENGITEVWLKDKSPSCGVTEIYDGSFAGNVVCGCGVTCALLKRNGIKVVEIP